jgi:hypothetical protein
MNTLRMPWYRRSTTYTLAVTLVVLLLIMVVVPVLAEAMDPIFPDPIDIEEPYPVPDNGFEWVMPARYGLYKDGKINFHWDEALAKYEPAHVNPNEFIVILDGCRTWEEDETGTSQLTYTWTINGQVKSGHTCRIRHSFPAQATYPATLRIIKSDGSVLLDSQGRGDPFTQSIVVKDFLIVSIGDSYASGEGNPDRWQELGGSDLLGQPTYVASPAVWQDRRCHRSAHSAPAQAAFMLEMADPHSSVTFLSFACSGATINTHNYDDAAFYDPYQRPPTYPLVKDRGTGILGPGCGQEPPNPDRPQDNQLDSQMIQVRKALTNNYTIPARPVDALLISAGGNDMGFVPVIKLCALYWECETDVWVSSQYGGLKYLKDRVTDDVNELPAKYAALAADIETYIPFSPNGHVYITQYPDSTRDSSGGYCNEMVTDLIPWWISVGATGSALFGGAYTIPLLPHRIDQDEATWAGGTVGPALNNKIAAAADVHDWILVDGINDSTANLFATHGYCAADNWIRTATESMSIQGPWSSWFSPHIWPADSTRTTGTMHPTTTGNRAVAQRIMAKMGPNLLPAVEPPGPPTFSSTSNGAIVSSSGWFTGHAAGTTCPGGAADCTFAQVVATSAAGTAINGASVLLNGAPVACSATGVTAGGLTCRAELTTAQTYTWSLTFANDGIYQMGFSASSLNGGVATYSRQVKVDLTNPLVNHELSSTAEASGWYRVPVTVTLTTADGAGSGPATINFQLDGDDFVAGGNQTEVDVYSNGVHSLNYRAIDIAGRIGTLQSLTIPIDQLAPVSAATVVPAPNASGWHSGTFVAVTLNTADSGGSGLAGMTYSASGAQPIASTTVDGANPIELAITTEGVTTINFAATDVAGNLEATKTVTVRIDRGAPVVSCAAADGQWHADNVSVLCTASDSGAGLANASDASFNLTTAVPNGSETADAATGSRQVCDALANCVTAGPVTNNKVDRKAPVLNCAAADEQWHAVDVSRTCTASDSGSGLAETSSANFSLSTSVAVGTESSNALTSSRDICDALGHCVIAGPLGGNKVDKKGPTITITAPSNTIYLLNANVTAGYNCADDGSGVATCTGPVASGSAVDTTSPGTKSFAISAMDNVGNTASQSVSYKVAYGLCMLFDQTRSYKIGSTVPIKLQLCDTGGSNMSAADIVLKATGLTKIDNTASSVVEDAGSANPDSNFRYDAALGGYIFNLSTKGLSTGTWSMSFTVTNDPTTHNVEFDLR